MLKLVVEIVNFNFVEVVVVVSFVIICGGGLVMMIVSVDEMLL